MVGAKTNAWLQVTEGLERQWMPLTFMEKGIQTYDFQWTQASYRPTGRLGGIKGSCAGLQKQVMKDKPIAMGRWKNVRRLWNAQCYVHKDETSCL